MIRSAGDVALSAGTSPTIQSRTFNGYSTESVMTVRNISCPSEEEIYAELLGSILRLKDRSFKGDPPHIILCRNAAESHQERRETSNDSMRHEIWRGHRIGSDIGLGWT
jgi:hypothetical protein